LVVVRDAQTGKLRQATAAELRVLRAQQIARPLAAAAASGPVTVRRDGTLHKRLGERGMVYSVATRDADGKLGMQCVKGEQAAEAALGHSAPAGQEHHHDIR
jgi:hypothetical protein